VKRSVCSESSLEYFA